MLRTYTFEWCIIRFPTINKSRVITSWNTLFSTVSITVYGAIRLYEYIVTYIWRHVYDVITFLFGATCQWKLSWKFSKILRTIWLHFHKKSLSVKKPYFYLIRSHMFYGNLAQLGKKSNSVIRSRSVMVKNWCNVLSIEGVTVCGHHPECRITFGRGGPHIVWWDPRTDHSTSLETSSNVPWHIPAREAYWKVASPSE